MTEEYDDRAYYINLIVDKLYNAFRYNKDFLLDISEALKDRVEDEIRFEKIHSDKKEISNDEQHYS